MSSTPFKLPGLAASAPSALVVEPVLPHLLFVLSALSSAGFDVIVAETFKDAKASLAISRPALLLTDVRLREFNGLHLVLRSQAAWAGLPAIVTHQTSDAVLQAEAERLGATFVVLPTTREELVAAVYRTTLRSDTSLPLKEPIRMPFERRSAERRALAPVNPLARDRRITERRRDAAVALRHSAAR